MDASQIEQLLARFREEHFALGQTISSLERLLSLLRSEVKSGEVAPSEDQLKLSANGKSPTAIKGTISIRQAIVDILKESKRPMHSKDIWELAYARGARTGAKRPAAIVALSASGIDGIEKVGPRTFQWKGD